MESFMTTKEVLVAAKALIDTPDKWFGKGSRASGGKRCAWYAIADASGPSTVAAVTAFASVLPRSIQFQSSPIATVIEFNDTRTHKTVMKAFDRAIEAAS